jgi:hypothetical protein
LPCHVRFERRLPHYTDQVRCWLFGPQTILRIDLRREFDLATSKPRHLAPPPKLPGASLRAGLGGVTDALPAQHVLEMFRRALPEGAPRRCLGRLSNRLTKIITEARKLATP